MTRVPADWASGPLSPREPGEPERRRQRDEGLRQRPARELERDRGAARGCPQHGRPGATGVGRVAWYT